MNDTTEITVKDYAKGSNGEVVKLGDLNLAKKLLIEISNKWKGFEVTEDNWRTDGVEAEKELRNARYDLQKINKAGNKFLTIAKRNYNETFNSLIDINIQKERDIKEKIDEFKDKAKKVREEKKRLAHEELMRIETLLSETEQKFALMAANAKNEDDLKEYISSINILKEDTENFGELDYKAMALVSMLEMNLDKIQLKVKDEIEKAKESERLRLENERLEKEAEKRKLEDAERLRMEKEEAETKRLAAEKRIKRIREIRKEIIMNNGFNIKSENELSYKDLLNVYLDDISIMNEIDWFEFYEDLKVKIKSIESEAKMMIAKARKKIKNDFEELTNEYRDLGGKQGTLKKNTVITIEMVNDLRKKTKILHDKKVEKRNNSIKKELNNVRSIITEKVGDIDSYIKQANFKNPETKEILNSLMNRFENAINDTFGS